MRHLPWLLLTSALAGCVSVSATTVSPASSPPPAAAAAPAEDPAFSDVAWLAGAWTTDGGGERRTEEHWTPVAGGTMFGINRVIAGGRTVFFEHLRIEVDDAGRLVYLASPVGRQPPTPFRLVESAPGRAVFENPDHDWPQRIVYEREPGGLRMRAEGDQDGELRVSEWRMRRVVSP